MVDFQRARAQMVENQLRSGGVTNALILASMRTVPRETFVPASRRELAYVDDLQWFGERGAPRRFMAAPATLAKLLKLADIQPTHTVLDLGAATGYSTAVIAGLAASVVGVEQDEALAATASANLAALGIDNARIMSAGFDAPQPSKFDVIVVQGTVKTVPAALFAALVDGGRLVTLIQAGATALAHVFHKSGDTITARAEFNAFLPPLPVAQANEEFVF